MLIENSIAIILSLIYISMNNKHPKVFIYADEPNYSDIGVAITKPSVPYNYVLEVTENVREIINSSCNNGEFNKARELLIKEFGIQKES